jgi:hypothetical protein
MLLIDFDDYDTGTAFAGCLSICSTAPTASTSIVSSISSSSILPSITTTTFL